MKTTMKSLIAISALLISFNVQANLMECMDVLTQGKDSNTFQINMDREELPNYGRDHLANAIVAIRELVRMQGCSKKEINFGKGPWGRSHSRCERIHRRSNSSRTCYVESNLGYFIVNRDFHTTANIIFSRWD